jgi:hypothetical protein
MAEQLIDSYSESNVNSDGSFSSTQARGQSFAVTRQAKLTSCKFYVKKSTGGTGAYIAKVFAHTGTYGTSSRPTGSDLATSDSADVSSLTTSYQLITYTFSGANQIILSADTKYCIHLNKQSSTGLIQGYDNSSPSHGGNRYWYYIVYDYSAGQDAAFYVYGYLEPTITTQACSSVASTSVTGNGNITDTGGINCTRRGFCYKVGSSGDPTTADSTAYDDGSYSTGAYTKSITGLSGNTTYRVRAYTVNTVGTAYGETVSVTTLKEDFTNPTNAYAADDVFATTPGTDGNIYVSISKDGGTNYTAELVKTFDGTNQYFTYGNGSTELWGTTLTGDDIDDTSLRIKIRCGSSTTAYQVYKTFGFAISASYILTGFEIKIKAKWITDTTYIDHVTAKAYYGTSVLPVIAGSQAYASDGRKNGEGAGTGTGVLVFYDGSNWIACDSGATVAA